MSRVTFFLLLCFVTLALVVQGVPDVVDHPDAQCVSKGFVASCDNLNWVNRELNCANIECIGRQNRAVSIGPALDGTVCKENKICSNGLCQDLPRGERMPRENGENETFYICTRVDVPQQRGPGSK